MTSLNRARAGNSKSWDSEGFENNNYINSINI